MKDESMLLENAKRRREKKMDKLRYVFSNGKEIKTFIRTIEEIEKSNSFDLYCIKEDMSFRLVSRDRFTEMLDKNKKEIYENDNVIHKDFNGLGKVTFSMGCFRVWNFTIVNFAECYNLGELEVISISHQEELEK